MSGMPPQSEGICGGIPPISNPVEDRQMEIRVDIKLDNGSTDKTVLNGNISSEELLDLVSKFTDLYKSSLSTQPALAAPQVATNTLAVQPQALTTTPTNQPTSQILQPKTNPHETRNFGIAEEEYSQLKNESLTIKERLELFLNFEYKGQWFTSLEVKKDYDRIYGPINLSTVSTYLSRLYREEKLERTGNRNQRKYCVKELPEPPELQVHTFEAAQYQRIR
ncbi:MAG: hypothetical protein KAR76_00105 [Methanosarcinales archaeon]|nr:hypothetical protein [Methanosarcinales archaeon]